MNQLLRTRPPKSRRFRGTVAGEDIRCFSGSAFVDLGEEALGTSMATVIAGKPQPLSEIPGHSDIEGIFRLALLDARAIPGKSFHVSAHIVSPDVAPADDFRYTTPHSHDFDELNIVLSENAGLTYLYEVDGKRFTADSPATVFVPAGARHRMEAVSGQGIFLCLHPDPASQRKGDE